MCQIRSADMANTGRISDWKDKSLTCEVELQNEERLQTADAVVNGHTVTRNDSVGSVMRKLLRGAHRKLRNVSSGSGTGGNAGNLSGISPTDGEVFTVTHIVRHTVKRNAELSNQNGSSQDGTEENRLSVMESNSQVKIVVSGSANLPRIDFNSNCLHSELKAVCSETESGYRSGTGNELWNQRGNESERLTSRLRPSVETKAAMRRDETVDNVKILEMRL